jgi:hypothetical protein
MLANKRVSYGWQATRRFNAEGTEARNAKGWPGSPRAAFPTFGSGEIGHKLPVLPTPHRKQEFSLYRPIAAGVVVETDSECVERLRPKSTLGKPFAWDVVFLVAGLKTEDFHMTITRLVLAVMAVVVLYWGVRILMSRR